MTASKLFVKTAAALAIVGGFGIAQAQTSLADPKVNSQVSPTVRQTVEPGSGQQGTLGAQPSRTDETVRQTVQPGSGTSPSSTGMSAQSNQTGVNQNRVPDNMNSNRGAMEPRGTNNANMGSSTMGGSTMGTNDSMRMGSERGARMDRN